MKLLLVLTFATLALCDEIDDLDIKKRGATKTSILNAIPNNGHQKAEQYSYFYRHQPSSGQQPGQQNFVHSQQNQPASSYYSPLPTQSVSNSVPHTATNSDAQNVFNDYPNPYNIVPQQPSYYPIQFLSQPSVQSKIQLVPAKLVNGQIQIISQPSILTPQIQSAQQTLYPQNVAHQTSGNPQYSASIPQSTLSVHNSYALLPNGGYQNQITSPLYSHPSSLGQMLILTQPVPQFYNNYLSQSPLYSNAGQQLSHYHQPSQQAKYQLLNGSGSQPTNNNDNNYQQYSTDSEYDKPLSGPITQKSENDLSISEYTNPSESNTGYKSTNTYTSREQVYKTS